MTDSLLLPLLDAATRGALLAVLSLLIVALLRASRATARANAQATARWSAIALCAGLCVQVIGSTPMFEDTVAREWQAPLVAISVGNAVLFWIFVQALFDDDFTMKPRHLVLWLSVALLAGCNCGFVVGSSSLFAPVLVGVQRAIPAVFALLAAWVAISNWQSDLVESRRRLRAFVVVAGIGYTLAMVVARIGTVHGRLDSVMSLVDMAALLAILAPVAALTFRMEWVGLFGREATNLTKPDALRAQSGSAGVLPSDASAPGATSREVQSPADAADAADLRLAQELHRLMTEERAYRRENMNVSSLAAQLAVPAYRLRRVINRQLGYRNFNAYINGYRLAEARAVLADSTQQELPILTIALEAGFQSIGPFNRAFKAMTGVTPSEFRQQHISSQISPISEIG